MSALQQTIDVKIRALVSGLKEVQKLQGELIGIERAAGKKLSVNTSPAESALTRVLGLFNVFSNSSSNLTNRHFDEE